MSIQQSTSREIRESEGESTMSAIAVGGFSAAPVSASARGESPADGRSHLRVTRRGRVVFGTLLALVIAGGAIAAALGGGGAAAAGGASEAHFSHVTVLEGQSLWQIAEKVAPSADPRDVIAAIVDLNQLPSSTVSPGEKLAIPTQYSH
jgi:hypothetical protein